MVSLQISIESKDKPTYSDDTPYGETLSFKYEDISDFNIHQLISIFEKVARSLGYSEETIMRGGCQLAFNDMRDPNAMKKVAEEYDLGGEF